jgi:hypothetical protein
MATFQRLNPLTVIAGAVVRIYRFVQLQTDGKYDEVGTAQARADGLAVQDASADGKPFAMEPLPSGAIAKVEAGAAVSRGAQIASDTQGRAIAAVSGAGNYILGVARQAASGAGEIIEVQLAQHQDGLT